MNKRGIINILIFLSAAIHGIRANAAEQPLDGAKAAIEYYDGEVATFDVGVKLFSDRGYKVAECPAWLKGQKFIRNSIMDERFYIATDGVLTLITPTVCTNKISASQVKLLEKRGFERINKPAEFQLFGQAVWDVARIYQKHVKAG